MNETQRDSALVGVGEPLATHGRPEATGGSGTAGDMLRSARESAGLHIDSLAAALKVPVKKLEALEGNRWEELTDATFSRALASSVARHLRLDPAVVLAALPAGKPVPLVISGGLGRAASAHGGGSGNFSATLRWVVGLVLLAALLLYFAPQWLPSGSEAPRVSPRADADAPAYPAQEKGEGPAALGVPSDAAAQATQATETSPAQAVSPAAAPVLTSTAVSLPAVVSSPPVATLPGAGAAAQVAPGKELMTVYARGDTWLEVRDDAGRLRIQRLVKAGEGLSFEEGSAYTVVVGNATATDVTVRGKGLDLLALTKNNVVRLEIK